MEVLHQLESSFLLFLQNDVRTPALTWVLTKITALGNAGWFWIALAACFLIIKKYRRTGGAMALALILDGLAVNVFLKNLVCRVRPYDVIQGLIPAIERQKDWSFPSGHAACSMAAAVAIMLTVKSRWRFVPLVLALVISFSRLYVGVHYPTDVLAGMIIGALCGLAGERILRALEYRRQKGRKGEP